LALLGLWAGRFLWNRKRGLDRLAINPALLVGAILAVVIMLAGVAALGGLDTSLRRWGKFSEELSSRNPRLLVAQVCIRMLPDAGAGASVPARFRLCSLTTRRGLATRFRGIWLYAHDDYLQTLLEWGWIGGALWAVYLLGGLVFSGRTVFRHRLQLPAQRSAHFFRGSDRLARRDGPRQHGFPPASAVHRALCRRSARHPVELPELDWQIRCAQPPGKAHGGGRALIPFRFQGKPYRASNDEFLNHND